MNPKDNSLNKILLIIGSRPDVIKMAPLVFALKKQAGPLELRICDTGQHRELKQPMMDFFELKPDYELHSDPVSPELSSFIAQTLEGLAGVIADFGPDWVLVHGDTSTAFAGALAAFYAGAGVGHVEAGLRTPLKRSPFPEEMNRRLLGQLADLHFCPTPEALENLLEGGIPMSNVFLCGNTIVDALIWALHKMKTQHLPAVEAVKNLLANEQHPEDKNILLTLHRRENLNRYLDGIGEGIRRICQKIPCRIYFPTHNNPRVLEWARTLQQEVKELVLLPPQPYEAFIWLMQSADLILTDSGGIQEEAPTLGKHAILLRETTERPEALESGAVIGVTVAPAEIEDLAIGYFQGNHRPLPRENPFGDGHAADKIVEILLEMGNH